MIPDMGNHIGITDWMWAFVFNRWFQQVSGVYQLCIEITVQCIHHLRVIKVNWLNDCECTLACLTNTATDSVIVGVLGRHEQRAGIPCIAGEQFPVGIINRGFSGFIAHITVRRFNPLSNSLVFASRTVFLFEIRGGSPESDDPNSCIESHGNVINRTRGIRFFSIRLSNAGCTVDCGSRIYVLYYESDSYILVISILVWVLSLNRARSNWIQWEQHGNIDFLPAFKSGGCCISRDRFPAHALTAGVQWGRLINSGASYLAMFSCQRE